MASFKLLAFKLSFTPLFLAFLSRPALAEQIFGLTSLDIPQYLTQRSAGLRYERLEKFENLRILDQRSVEFSVFPSMKVDRGQVLKAQKERGESDRISHSFSMLDISPSVEKCLAATVCLGIVPLSAQIYLEENHFRLYFSPALSLRVQYIDADDRRWDLKLQTKLYCDRNFNDMLTQEASTISVGVSL